jgi:predicted nucleic acid-binding protein
MLIDSNILVYAINTASPKHKKAQLFLQDNSTDLVVAHQNILETIRVLTHPKFTKRMKLKDALASVGGIIKVARIIQPKDETYYIVLELMKKYHLKGDEIFDAYLVSTALSNDVDLIVTDNIKDFKKLKEIKIINPFDQR